MSVSLKKETLHLNEAVCTKYDRAMIEGDLIVPDVKPDIAKILLLDGDVFITDKSISGSCAAVSGELKINILYLADGERRRVNSMSASLPFRHTVDALCGAENPTVSAEAETESMSFSLINSRKINVRAAAGINLKLTAPQSVELAAELGGVEPIEILKKNVRILNSACDGERTITVTDQIELPAGKPPIGEVLKASASVIPRGIHMLENQAAVSGDVKTVVLYVAADEEESLQFFETAIPFEEIVPLAGANDSIDGEADYRGGDVYFSVMEDSDGDRRIIGLEVSVGVSIRGSETLSVNAVCDAYALRGEAVCTRKAFRAEHIIDKITEHLTQKDDAELPEYLPEISQVFDCVANPHVESVKIEDGKIIVGGTVLINLLYMSDDENMPVADFAHTSSFTQIFDTPSMEQGAVCDARVETEHINYKLTGAHGVELRYVIGITVKLITESGLSAVDEIEWDENAEMPEMPSMVIYFVRGGDTLWDIAKRYRTTVENILAHNNVDEDNLQIGQRLFVIK